MNAQMVRRGPFERNRLTEPEEGIMLEIAGVKGGYSLDRLCSNDKGFAACGHSCLRAFTKRKRIE